MSDAGVTDAATAASPRTSGKSRGGLLKRLTGGLDGVLRRLFYRLGYAVATHPWKVIAAALLLAIAGGAGFLRFTTESRGDKLWVPQGSAAQRNRRIVDPSFGDSRRLSQILFTGKDEEARDDIGTKDGMLDMVNVARAAFEVSGEPVDKPNGDGTPTTLEERCVKQVDLEGNEYCFTVSPLDLFYDAADVVNEDGKPSFLATVEKKIQGMSDAEVKKTLVETDGAKTWRGTNFEAEQLIAVKSGKVTGMLFQMINENSLKLKDGEEVDEESDSWEEALVDKLIDGRSSISAKATTWFVDTFQSQEASLETALTGDLSLFAIGIVFLVIYVVLFLGEFHVIQSRMWLGGAAVLTSGLGIVFTYGICSAVGMFYGPVHNVLPLLIVGIGVDDIMVIVKTLNELDRSNPRMQGKDVPSRIALALSQAGVAITVTSLTNFIVFLAASVSRLPALRFFSLWAAVAVLADFFFSTTFFVALLSFDQRRIDANRRDCCACLPPVKEPKTKNWFRLEFGVFNRFFSNFLGPLILRPVVRIIVLVFFTALLAVTAWGASRLYLKFKFSFFYPDGTSQKDFQDALDNQFLQAQPSNVYTTNVDFAAADTQKRMIRMCRANSGVIAKNEWVEGSSVDCWYEAMRNGEGFSSDEQTFSASEFPSKLKTFLAGPGKRYREDVVLDGDKIKIARVAFLYRYADTNDEEIERLETLREDVTAVGFGASTEGENAGENAFPYGFADIFTEQYIALPREVATALILSIVAVGIVTFILVGNPIAGIICMLVVGFILVNVVGFMNFTGYNLNSVSVIALSVSVGFACDTVVHIARGFLEMVGTRKERVIQALGELGPPVFHAAMSTLVAVLILFFSKSYIFKSLFWGFFTLLITAMLHGLILTPVILSFIGPSGLYATEEEKAMHELALEESAAGKRNQGKEGVAESGNVTEEVDVE